ncbi:L,D-transpeptidase family protein [Hansschlegelia zhihuaiae]|nr:L,D-transpeptidase family protein [Hansschlegelia zhihuaiae]
MPTKAEAPSLRRAVLSRPVTILLASVAFGALLAGHTRAESAQARTPEPAQVAVPPQEIVPPAVGERDFSTGAIEAAPADPAPNPQDALQPSTPPSPSVIALEPLPAAIVALLNDAGPAGLKMPAADREALKAFYAARHGAPVWIADGRLSPKADAAKARIAAADGDALDPRDFRLPGAIRSDAPAELARAEAQMSAASLAYARKAWGGRFSPGFISPSITAAPSPFDAAAALASLDTSGDVAATLDGFNPQHRQFQELRKLLAAARVNRPTEPETPKIGFGKLLQPGDEDPRVPALRARLGVKGDADDFYYDAALEEAVVAFQKKAKIGTSGLVNKQTVRALNAGAPRSPRDDAELIEINMERWRWMPRDLGAKHVFVDVPAFKLHIMQDGAAVYETRVIVGKSTNQTPIFSNAIDHIVVNPYWNVPSSIALNEMRGGSLRGFEVVDSRGRKVTDFSWDDIRANRVRIRQPPGEKNALGHIKFMFPNSHSVYLHDTPTRKLFERDARALSHGCVRVDRPLEFADALSGDQGLSGAKLQSMVGGKERRLNLGQAIPVHLTYFTAWVGADGKIETRADLYTLDARQRAAMRGEPLPPLPEAPPPAPRVAKAKPKPASTAPAMAASAVPAAAPQQQPSGPAAWLARIFGDSRQGRP